jgi:predicted Zn-dependent protease
LRTLPFETRTFFAGLTIETPSPLKAPPCTELAVAGRALPNDADIRFLTGSLQRRQGKWVEATAQLKTAATLDPRNSIFQIELAGIYRQQRRYPEAAQVLDAASL